jgi:hypothetical protein
VPPGFPASEFDVFTDRAIRAAAFVVSFFATLAWAGEARVPYVPTPQEVVDRMLETARVGPGDYLIDLGSGDGRIVVTAARKHGARGFGVDLNPERIRESNENARNAGVAERVSFLRQDLFATDLSQATVITMYLLPRVNIELRPRLLELRPGTRLVSHDFDMGDWRPDIHFSMDAKEKYGGADGTSDVYFWVVPARVAGVWQWELPVRGKTVTYEVRLEQKYQTVTGSAWAGGRTATLRDVRLRGSEFQFSFTIEIEGAPVKHEYSGKIEGNAITGAAMLSGARVQSQLEWSARRFVRNAAGTREPRLRFSQSAPGAIH